ncbi:MAG: alpha/beta hydrolase [Rhizobiales bacterium]|nr:alpha/beta hydrolase [Hyphomicrobiales bacterium]
MLKFISQNVEIAYETAGNPANPPILLIHGFGSTHINNWVQPGWVEFLLNAGYFVVMFDNRGHGMSQKLYDSADYDVHKMADDAHNLMVHLNIKKYNVLGYSMGARISAFVAMQNPASVKRVILGGLGYNIIDGTPGVQQIANGLFANTLEDVKDKLGRMFRIFADHTGSDRKALAACILSPRRVMLEAEVKSIKQPVLVAIGTVDDVAGDGPMLTNLLSDATFLSIPKRDHMRATGDKVFKNGVAEFLVLV